MEERREGAAKFLEACSSLMTGKYNTAESGISRVLAEIAASEPLKELFSAVTKNFNYAAAKRRYLQAPAKRGERGRAYLPTDRREILAFLFCLFVEIDANTVPFDDFLLRYFYVDGSYTASYTLFADRMVRPFMEIVRDCFPPQKESDVPDAREETFGKIAELLPYERARLARFILPEDARAAADLLLAGLMAAATRRDVTDMGALLAGYRYFLRAIGGEDANSSAIFSAAAQL